MGGHKTSLSHPLRSPAIHHCRLPLGTREPCQALCCLHRAIQMMQVTGRSPQVMQNVCRFLGQLLLLCLCASCCRADAKSLEHRSCLIFKDSMK